MCERCLELEEEVIQLRELLGKKYDVEAPQYGMTGTEWQIFRILQDHPEGVHKLKLYAVPARGDATQDIDASLKVMVCKMRKKLTAHGFEIQPIWGKGYVLVNRNKEAA